MSKRLSYTQARNLEKAFLYVIVFASVFMSMFPIYWIYSASLMTRREIESGRVWIPSSLQFRNFRVALFGFNLLHYIRNSFIYAISITALQVILSAGVGYGLAKFSFRGRSFLFSFIVATMLIPTAVIIVPLYILMINLNFIDTPFAVILPAAMSGFGIFMIRQFMVGIPNSLIDQGRVGGASEFKIFYKIVMPLTRPALATLAVFTFNWSFNAFLWPLIVLNTHEWAPMTVGLNLFQSMYYNSWELIYAGAAVATLPTIVLFIFAQKQFVRSLRALSGIKT